MYGIYIFLGIIVFFSKVVDIEMYVNWSYNHEKKKKKENPATHPAISSPNYRREMRDVPFDCELWLLSLLVYERNFRNRNRLHKKKNCSDFKFSNGNTQFWDIFEFFSNQAYNNFAYYEGRINVIDDTQRISRHFIDYKCELLQGVF